MKQKLIQPVEKDSIEYYKEQISKEIYIWDMRCWDKYHDKEEVINWLENGCIPNNCGHAVFCINKLKNKYNMSNEQITELILQNNNAQYKNRLAKCFKDPNLCPKYKEYGYFVDCEECDGKKKKEKTMPPILRSIKELSAMLVIGDKLDGEIEEQMNNLIKKWKDAREL